MKKKYCLFLTISLFMMLIMITPVFAKNMHLPEDAIAVDYYSCGMGGITLPSTWPPVNKAMTGLTIRIDARHHEAGTYGSYDSLNIDALGPNGHYLPLTYFMTSPDLGLKTMLKAIFTGMPIGNFPQNLVTGLTENDLVVQRHGNRIFAELKTPQTVRWPGTGFPLVTIPRFSLELDNFGGSLHFEYTDDFTGYSGYVLNNEVMGFEGTGTLTCSAWNYETAPMAPVYVFMHGITTIYPP
jgi:hypothetical protein